MFRIGQLVERIGGEGERGCAPPLHTPLHVTWIGDVQWAGRVYEVIEVEGYPAPETGDYYRGYNANYFRAVVEKSTDTGMAILREILDRESFDVKTPERHKA